MPAAPEKPAGGSSITSAPFLQPVTDPSPGRDYTTVLRVGAAPAMRAVIGVMLGLAAYFVVVPVVAQLVLGLAWLVRRPGGTFADYSKRAFDYLLPEGLLATHVGLAMLIPISFLLVWGWHRVAPKWLPSVQPGLRWRYLIGCLVLSAISLNAVLWLSEWGTQRQWSVPSQAWLWVLCVLIASPFQAAGEEFFFRGYLMQAVGGVSGNKWIAVVGSALVFAMFHGTQNIWLFINRFAFGLLAGTLVVVTGGLEAGIAAHIINNVFAFGYAIFSGGAAQAKGVREIGPITALWDVAGFALTAALCWWFGRRLNVARTTPGRI